MSPTGRSGSLLRISGIILETVLRLLFLQSLPLNTTEVLKTEESSVEGHYTVTRLHPESSTGTGSIYTPSL